MTTNKLYHLAHRYPEVYLLLFKWYLESLKTSHISCSNAQAVNSEKKDHSIEEEPIIEQDEEEQEIPLREVEIPSQDEVHSKQTIEILNENVGTFHLDSLVERLGGKSKLSDEEFCKLFEGGENGLFFKQVESSYSIDELIKFLSENVIPHPSFSNLKRFPMTWKANDLVDLIEKKSSIVPMLESIIGCESNTIRNLREDNPPFLSVFYKDMELTFDLKLGLNSFIPNKLNTVTKLKVSCPMYDIFETFNYCIQNWENLEEIDCTYYTIVLNPLKSIDSERIIEISIRSDVHPEIVESLIIKNPCLTQLNLSLRYLLEYHHRLIGNTKTK